MVDRAGGYSRVTVLAPRRQVDLALPADLPVAELTPMVLELLGEPARTAQRPVPWRLTGPTGGVLHPEATLAALGVLDGELLRIGPVAPAPPAPVFDDPVDALASAVVARAGRPGGGLGRRLGPAAMLVLAVAAAGLLAGARTAPRAGPLVVGLAIALGAIGAACCVLCTAAAVRAADPDPGPIALAGALAAVPLAAAAGWAVLPGPPGPAHLVLAAAAAGTTAAAGQAALRVVAPVLVGVTAVAVVTGAAALVGLWTGAPTAALAAAAGAVALAAGPVLPRCALRLAGLPRPLVPVDGGELVAADTGLDLLPPGELTERAHLARGHLLGSTGGAAVVAAAAAILTAQTPGWTSTAFAAVTVAVLALRALGFVDPMAVHTLLGAALVGCVGMLVPVGLAAGPTGRLGVALVLLLGAAGAGLATGGGTRVGSPVARRALDLLEVVLVAATVPLALGVMGLYGLVRGL